MNKKGFTIVEVLVVIGIIYLMAFVSIPLFNNYQKTTKLKSEARLLATNLRLTQQLAITEQNIYTFQLFPLNNNYQIINSASSEVVKDVTLDSEVTIATTTGLTSSAAQFNPTGAAIETGFIYLINTKNQTSTIEIKPSGYVQVRS